MRRFPLYFVICFFITLLVVNTGFAATLPVMTPGRKLQYHFIKQLDPEKMVMIFDEEPGEEGYIRDVYMDLKGAVIGGVRIKSLVIRGSGIQLSPVHTWGEDGPEVEQILNIHAKGIIDENDINQNLLQKEFGDDGHWHNLQLDIHPGGIYAKGYYLVRMLFKLDILIEIESRLKIVDFQQIWLDQYTVRVNRVDIPAFITEKAVSQIQPLLDLSRFVFPLKLTSISYDDTSITLSSSREPEPFDGIIYQYEKGFSDPVVCSPKLKR